MRLFTVALIALVCAAETKPPEPAVKEKETKTVTRVVVVAPVVRAPLRYYGYSLLGNLIGSGIAGAVEAHRNRVEQQQNSIEPAAPYVPQQYEPPALAEIRVESAQPGAAVFIDAKAYGVAPVSVLVTPGSRYVAVHADGFENWSRDIDARTGAPQTLAVELKKIPVDQNVIVIK